MQTDKSGKGFGSVAAAGIQGGKGKYRGYVSGDGACGDGGKTTQERYLKILEFRHFERHIVFSQSDRISKKKAIFFKFQTSFSLLE